tara:strand:- start:53 stop:2869 length:2817 start_codon:yes stop_codon:yes gene_type:complete
MKTKRFLELVLAHEGEYCVWANKGVKPNESIKQTFCPSIDELLHKARDLNDNGWNAFFALGTFFDGSTRAASNMQWMKSFFLDLDCGPDKDFPSQAVAIDELRNFCENNGLPTPTLVNSGRGVHTYWILSEPVCREDWWPVAERLKMLCEEQGFAADPSRTSDAASILRVPSTHNHKYGDPLPVEFYGVEADFNTVDFDKFATLLGDEPIPVPKRREASAVSAFKDAMYQNYKGSFKRLLLKTKNGTGCNQIKHIIKNQDSISHDLWRAGLSIANVCEDGAEAAHIMSARHEDYSVQGTLKKMEDTGGPHFCSTIERLNPDGCEGCPNKGKITTPAVLTKEVKEATPEDNVIEEIDGGSTKQITIPTLPRPYFRGQNGGVYLRSVNEDDEPEEICIYHHDFYVTRRLHDVELGEVIAFALHLPRDGTRDFVVPLSAVTSREEFRKHMSMQGIVTYGKDIDKLMAYTAAWIKELQQTTTASEAHQQFGWVDDEKMDAFVLGDQLITASGMEYNPPSSKTSGHIHKFKPKGSKERHKEILDFYNQEGMELQQFTVCAGFGTILMPLTGLYSLGIHLFGETGGGKTTAMYTGTAIWGEPRGLTGTKADTPNSRMNFAEVMHNLGLNTDEMTNIHGKQASDYAYQLSEGTQKNRMAGGGNYERVRGRPWHLIALSSGNVSMYAQMAMAKGDTKAEMQRLLELRVDEIPMVEVDPVVSASLFKDIQLNYGHYGPEFVQYVIENKAAVTADYERIKAKLDKCAGLNQKNRFWSGGCSAILAGAVAAKRAGIVDYDVKELFKWVVGQLIRVKAFVDDSTASVQTLVTEFTTEHWGSILKIKSTEKAQNAEGVTPMVIPEQNPRGMFVARYETDTNMLYIVPKAFKMWLGEQKIDYTSTVEGMQKDMGAKRMKMRLTRGTNFNLPSIWVLSVKLVGFSGVSEATEV